MVNSYPIKPAMASPFRINSDQLKRYPQIAQISQMKNRDC